MRDERPAHGRRGGSVFLAFTSPANCVGPFPPMLVPHKTHTWEPNGEAVAALVLQLEFRLEIDQRPGLANVDQGFGA